MEVELSKIEAKDFPLEQNRIFTLIDQIWKQPEIDNAKHSIQRWGDSGKESGTYFYILQQDKPIGITGYYLVDPDKGWYGLRHHGTTVKGTGRFALDELISYIKSNHSDFKSLIEQIPEGHEDLIKIFKKWGFQLINSGQHWEPKKDHYKYVMAREA